MPLVLQITSANEKLILEQYKVRSHEIIVTIVHHLCKYPSLSTREKEYVVKEHSITFFLKAQPPPPPTTTKRGCNAVKYWTLNWKNIIFGLIHCKMYFLKH